MLPNARSRPFPTRLILSLVLLLNACTGLAGDSRGTSTLQPVRVGCGFSAAAVAATLETINALRAQARQCGSSSHAAAPPLQWNDQLQAAASFHSQDMAGRNFVSHTGHDGSSPRERTGRAGYAGGMIGENVSAGTRAPGAALANWLQSPGHCANLMDPGFTEVGLACASADRSSYGMYWTMVLGHRGR